MNIVGEISGSDGLCNDRPFLNGFTYVIPQQATESCCIAIGPPKFLTENGQVLFREEPVASGFSTL
jgi:hypothetical protein